MGKVIVSQFISVDGVVEDPGGVEGFDRGGWAFQFDRGPEGDQFKLDEVLSSEALLLGRSTYDVFAASWPSREGEMADKFNSMPKYVVSSTLKDPEWNNTTVIDGTGDVAEAVQRIRQDHAGEVLVNGSVQLVQLLAENGLVDEYRLMTFPTVLGAGKQLFGATAAAIPLRLVETRPAGETVVLVFQPKK